MEWKDYEQYSSMITANQQYSFNNTKKHLGKVASDLT